ncbi:hypothetical protein, partial [Mesorhizobium sp. M2D.F.Ca.ET.223.01.1.1]|uniref:hypothetical protein n=1 Tax=Mesorhizobium sp. M2D.F.Ca.ET.223.01.1.1 TaxID=2563940 RepID=UPI001AEDCC47
AHGVSCSFIDQIGSAQQMAATSVDHVLAVAAVVSLGALSRPVGFGAVLLDGLALARKIEG